MRLPTLGWVLVLVACDRGLPIPSVSSDGGKDTLPTLEVLPSADPNAVPPVARFVVHVGSSPVLPEEVVLVSGTLGKAHLRELAKGDPSSALQRRIVETVTFSDGGDVVVSPTQPLAPGGYTLAVGRLGFAVPLGARSSLHGERILQRIWPPIGSPGSPSALVYCALGWEASGPVAAQLEPKGPSGTFHPGVVDGRGSHCVRFAPDGAWESGARWVPPPEIAPGIALDPSPLASSAGHEEDSTPLVCEAHEVPFGPGCAEVLDDRLLVRAPDRPVLWVVGWDERAVVRATLPREPFVLRGLEPSTATLVHVAVLDERGTEARSTLVATTRPAHAHVVLNEVMANPLGAEPAEEWIELTNDGSVAADLGGLQIVDVGGVTVLPSATLEPGAFALVVSESFVAEDGLDPTPPDDVPLIRVSKLGKSGLGNAGEPLELRGLDGDLLSRFPASPAPKPGVSVVRRRPDSPDEWATSFALSAEAASPGRPNHPRQP